MDSILNRLPLVSSSDLTLNDQCPNQLNSTQFVHDSQSFISLLTQIEEIGWSNIRLDKHSSSNEMILTIQYSYVDLADRCHDLFIDIPNRWPNERPQCRVNLPLEFRIDFWSPKTSRLIEIVENFRLTVDDLQFFWSQLVDLERDAIVLDRKPISFGSTSRCLKINDQIYVRVQVNLSTKQKYFV